MQNVNALKNQRVGDWYFSPKKFEKKGKFYESLGVRSVKNFFNNIGRKVNNAVKPKFGSKYLFWNKTLGNLKTHEKITRLAESWYVVFGVASLAAGVYYVAKGDAFMSTFNFAFVANNTYCTFLQRYNRERIQKTIQSLEHREKKRQKVSDSGLLEKVA